jgi:hypothetical protein
MAAHGWDTLPWEEKKKLGILTDGFYSLKPYSERFQDPTPQFNPELGDAPVREPKRYEWKPGGEVAEATPAAKPSPAEAAAAKKQQAAEAKAVKANTKQGTAVVDKQIQAIEKRLEELTRQSQGAKC